MAPRLPGLKGATDSPQRFVKVGRVHSRRRSARRSLSMTTAASCYPGNSSIPGAHVARMRKLVSQLIGANVPTGAVHDGKTLIPKYTGR